jgi:hypothetical protein
MTISSAVSLPRGLLDGFAVRAAYLQLPAARDPAVPVYVRHTRDGLQIELGVNRTPGERALAGYFNRAIGEAQFREDLEEAAREAIA